MKRATAVVKDEPISNESSRNIEHDSMFVGMVGFMFGVHDPHIAFAKTLKFTMPLPSLLGIHPAILEREYVRFHIGPPPA